jgi:hypothetical protein
VAADETSDEQSAMLGSAIFSKCEQYRYLLTRRISEHEKTATFIMLNPSTANAHINDPTIRKCIGFARRWQCGTLQVLNLFAVRATLPRDMKQAFDPVGPDNHQWFARVLTPESTHPHLVICAWGVHGAFREQDRTVLGWLHEIGIDLFALGLTRQGHPRHPLYMSYATELIPYTIPLHPGG